MNARPIPEELDDELDELLDAPADDETDEAEAEAYTTAPGRLMVFRTDEAGKVVGGYEAATILVPDGMHMDAGGLLRWSELRVDDAPQPDELWRQAPIVVPDNDRPINREPSLEVWHGTPEQPTSMVRFVEVRDLAKFRDPQAWRSRLGPVAFTLHRRASWRDPHLRTRGRQQPPELLGRWGPLDPVPCSLAPAAPPVVLLAVAGGMVRLAETGQTVDGLPVYAMSADQLAALLPRLVALDHASTARARAAR